MQKHGWKYKEVLLKSVLGLTLCNKHFVLSSDYIGYNLKLEDLEFPSRPLFCIFLYWKILSIVNKKYNKLPSKLIAIRSPDKLLMCPEQSFMFKPKYRFVGQFPMPSYQFVTDNIIVP